MPANERLTGLLLLGACVAASALSAEQPAPGAVKQKLPATVNGPGRELCPMISADGRTLYFTREVKDVEHQTIWYSERRPDGSWGPATKLAAPLNNSTTTFLSATLPDNNTLLVGGTFAAAGRQTNDWLTGGQAPKGPGQASPTVEQATKVINELAKAEERAKKEGRQLTPEEVQRIFAGGSVGAPAQPTPKPAPVDDNPNRTIALSHRTATGWSPPEYLRIKGFFNLAERNDFFLAPGNKVLVLSVQTFETVGKRDLYVSFQQADGSWSEPRNMGRGLNSAGNEISPFVAPDGQTLYLASDRPGGLGGFDIYMARRLDETWLSWSPPKNLGPTINGPLDEVNLTSDASGNYAFMSLGEKYKEDLYEFALPVEARPIPVAFVRGQCKNPAGQAVAASVSYERLKDGVGAGSASAHPTTGRYQIALAIGEDYSFRAEAAGHIPVSERLDLKTTREAQVVERDLVLVPIVVGASIRLNNIFFETAQATLLPESRRELDRLVALLKQRPTLAIRVAGHTDSEGADEANLRLSEARAASVRAYLAEHGVAATRLGSKGYGESQPIATNATPEGRQLNRRVEFTITKE
jgi:outer membrane protein OmpA-like peptidoglycan-associated protein